MAMSPDDLRNKTFSIVKKGYERGEVHRYLGSVADELQAFNAAARSDEEIVVADVVDEDEPSVVEEVFAEPDEDLDAEYDTGDHDADDRDGAEPADTSDAPAQTFSGSTSSLDDFDRMGNEISLMLRQAQESAFKIRSDAEVEARTLVDQVRLDIESDRLAHEQAAAELITRTEERAAQVRSEAEEYSTDVRTSADEYASEKRAEIDRLHEEAVAAAEADRTEAAATLANANEEAEATLEKAQKAADEVVAKAEADAQARSEELLVEAQATLANLTDAERDSRQNLEQAREVIDAALEKLDSSK